MKKFIDVKLFLGMTVVCSVIATGVWYFTDFGFWPALGIIVAAVLVNGWLATWEDEQPGGFNNPDHRSKDEK